MIQFRSHTGGHTEARTGPATGAATHPDAHPDTAARLAALDDTERVGDEIAELAAHLHAATYRLLTLLRDFDARDGWGGGFRSCAHWLSWRTGVALGPAREKVRVARALGPLPRISVELRHSGGSCDAHHVTHWADGGETKVGNLILLCRVHHRAVHEDGYGVEGDEAGVLHFRDPWGRLIPDTPAAPRVGPNPVAVLRSDNAGAGIETGAGIDFDEWTAAPAAPAGWDTRLDLDWAILALSSRGCAQRGSGRFRGEVPRRRSSGNARSET